MTVSAGQEEQAEIVSIRNHHRRTKNNGARNEEKNFPVLKVSTREKEEGEDSLKTMELFPGMASDTLRDFHQVVKPYLKH